MTVVAITSKFKDGAWSWEVSQWDQVPGRLLPWEVNRFRDDNNDDDDDYDDDDDDDYDVDEYDDLGASDWGSTAVQEDSPAPEICPGLSAMRGYPQHCHHCHLHRHHCHHCHHNCYYWIINFIIIAIIEIIAVIIIVILIAIISVTTVILIILTIIITKIKIKNNLKNVDTLIREDVASLVEWEIDYFK